MGQAGPGAYLRDRGAQLGLRTGIDLVALGGQRGRERAARRYRPADRRSGSIAQRPAAGPEVAGRFEAEQRLPGCRADRAVDLETVLRLEVPHRGAGDLAED